MTFQIACMFSIGYKEWEKIELYIQNAKSYALFKSKLTFHSMNKNWIFMNKKNHMPLIMRFTTYLEQTK